MKIRTSTPDKNMVGATGEPEKKEPVGTALGFLLGVGVGIVVGVVATKFAADSTPAKPRYA